MVMRYGPEASRMRSIHLDDDSHRAVRAPLLLPDEWPKRSKPLASRKLQSAGPKKQNAGPKMQGASLPPVRLLCVCGVCGLRFADEKQLNSHRCATHVK